MENLTNNLVIVNMTLSDIKAHVADMYDFDISESSISRITDKILPVAKEWQDRPLEDTYAVVLWTLFITMFGVKGATKKKVLIY